MLRTTLSVLCLVAAAMASAEYDNYGKGRSNSGYGSYNGGYQTYPSGYRGGRYYYGGKYGGK